MPVNLEVKGTLARLLATEDLIVEHKSVSTASFNVKSRVLTLPRWEKASNNVFDLLIAHEVGHALFTPNEDWSKRSKVPMGFVNVTEDVRIENLMKQKFAGLPKTFYRGYHELHDQDFFSIEELEISELNIADRVNLYFKVGSFVKVEFDAEEKVVVNQIGAARTFDEALAAAEALYALHKKQQEEKQEEQTEEDMSADADSSEEQSSSEEGADEAQGDEGRGSELDLETQETEGEGDEPGEGTGDGDQQSEEQELREDKTSGGQTAGDLDKVQTMDSLNESLEGLANTNRYEEPVYVTYPSNKTDEHIITNSDVHSYIQEAWTTHVGIIKENYPDRSDLIIDAGFGRHREKYQEFKRSIQTEVNYMVKEFECKKSAAAYSRASTSRTGILDCTKLHTYKYNEDLFKKVTTLPEGKNHGLVFILDWSGSMCDILEDTMKQLISLVMFCDKVGIPFDVYAFTNEWRERDPYSDYAKPTEAGVFYIPKEFTLLNIFTSRVNRKELNRQLETMFMIASSYSTRSFDIVPPRIGLSGTPLNESLVLLRKMLPEFKTANNVEKAHVMILTDGEAAPCRTTVTSTDYEGKESISVRRFVHESTYIRNRKTGTVVKIGSRGHNSTMTTVLLEDLRREFPESTFTGFRILENRSGWFVRQACDYDPESLAKWKKDKSVALTNFGYNKYYIVANSSIQQSAEFEVDEGATKAKIKSAFVKSLKSKKTNKKILGDFIGLIA